MDRKTIFQGQLPLETDLLGAQQFMSIALGYLARACLGSGTIAGGFEIAATSPASMVLTLSQGQIYALDVVEKSQWSTLPPDSRPLVRQGLVLSPTPLTFTAPATAGYAVNYLVQAAFSEIDTGDTDRPYYNATNPAVSFDGPGNSGNADKTIRQNLVALSAKQGIAAASGTQATPAPDPGFIGLYVVTVAQGQTQITSSNWSKVLPSFIPIRLPEIPGAIQNNIWTYVQGTGTASALQASISPAPTALVAGMQVCVKSPFTNTGNMTFNLNGLGNRQVLARDGTQLNPADVVNGQMVLLSYNGASWQLQSDRSAVAATFNIADTSLWHIGTPTAGSAVAMTTTLSPVPSSAGVGLCMRVPISMTNGAAPTLDFGFGAKPIVLNSTGQALTGKEMLGGVTFEADFIFDGTNARLMNPSPALQALGKKSQRFNSTSNPKTWTALQDGWVFLTLCGAGGGGGGAANQNGCSTPGAGGGYDERWVFVSAGEILTFNIAAGGPGGYGAQSGASAGVSTIVSNLQGELLRATGGGGGSYGDGFYAITGAIPGVGSGGRLSLTAPAVSISLQAGGSPLSAAGGNAARGGPGGFLGGQNAGGAYGNFPGGGGSGAASTISGQALSGGAGAGGEGFISY